MFYESSEVIQFFFSELPILIHLLELEINIGTDSPQSSHGSHLQRGQSEPEHRHPGRHVDHPGEERGGRNEQNS